MANKNGCEMFHSDACFPQYFQYRGEVIDSKAVEPLSVEVDD